MIENYDPTAPYRELKWTLKTEDFFSKWGFNEAGIFNNFIEDCQLNAPAPAEILKLVLDTFVMPKLDKSITYYKANTSHNLFRIDDSHRPLVPSIEIVITADQLFELLGY